MNKEMFNELKASMDTVFDDIIETCLYGEGRAALDATVYSMVELAGDSLDDSKALRELAYNHMASMAKLNQQLMMQIIMRDPDSFMAIVVGSLSTAYRLGTQNTTFDKSKTNK